VSIAITPVMVVGGVASHARLHSWMDMHAAPGVSHQAAAHLVKYAVNQPLPSHTLLV
jgi:hypothetical protein